MRLITQKYVIRFFTIYSSAKGSLEAFIAELESANWEKPSDVSTVFPTADVITGKRFVFNIKGNSYRLVVDIEFKKKLVFIVWIGTYADYDMIDVKTVNYAKSD